jgi:hypothetical protein
MGKFMCDFCRCRLSGGNQQGRAIGERAISEVRLYVVRVTSDPAGSLWRTNEIVLRSLGAVCADAMTLRPVAHGRRNSTFAKFSLKLHRMIAYRR